MGKHKNGGMLDVGLLLGDSSRNIMRTVSILSLM